MKITRSNEPIRLSPAERVSESVARTNKAIKRRVYFVALLSFVVGSAAGWMMRHAQRDDARAQLLRILNECERQLEFRCIDCS